MKIDCYILGKTSLIDKIMAEDNSNESNTYIGILHHEITKSTTGGSANEQQPSNGETYQYFDQRSRNRGHGIIQNELQNNNQGILSRNYTSEYRNDNVSGFCI